MLLRITLTPALPFDDSCVPAAVCLPSSCCDARCAFGEGAPGAVADKRKRVRACALQRPRLRPHEESVLHMPAWKCVSGRAHPGEIISSSRGPHWLA